MKKEKKPIDVIRYECVDVISDKSFFFDTIEDREEHMAARFEAGISTKTYEWRLLPVRVPLYQTFAPKDKTK